MALNYNFVKIEHYGSLAFSERPKIKEIKNLAHGNCSCVVTILAAHGEQALRIGNEVQAQGMHWEWVKVKNAVKIDANEKAIFKQAVKNVSTCIKNNQNILIHCSAGLHRTGIFAYCLLKHLGVPENNALDYIRQIRFKTFEAFEQKYKNIAFELSTT
ncbi:protein-tyrosine phosphatase family protein [Zooshikella sp. RANM57]|uniref:protein-tyrosine phosphatase family protein n=1 Tax=Zooshikella sp. RANM57 TaxID=3425863 RepID=UPI003D700AA2